MLVSQKVRAARTGGGLIGYNALITCVIALATVDATGKDETLKADALEYFGSETYKDHLTFLGLASDALPESLIGS